MSLVVVVVVVVIQLLPWWLTLSMIPISVFGVGHVKETRSIFVCATNNVICFLQINIIFVRETSVEKRI